MHFDWDPDKAALNLRDHGSTRRGDIIRIISARRATKRERHDYEVG